MKRPCIKGAHDGFVTSIALLPDPGDVTTTSSTATANGERNGGGGGHARFVISGSEGKPGGGYFSKGDGGIKVWRVSDGKCVHTASHQTGDITAFHVGPRRRRRRCAGSIAAGSIAAAAAGSASSGGYNSAAPAAPAAAMGSSDVREASAGAVPTFQTLTTLNHKP